MKKEKIKLVTGKFTKKTCLKNERGKMISKKFILYNISYLGGFVKLNTSKGQYIYHLDKEKILFEEEEVLRFSQISNNLVGIFTKKESYIYDLKGNLKLKGISDFRILKNGLFAFKKDDKWGFMEENLKVVIPPLWERVSNFNDYGYSIVNFKDLKRLAVIDRKGKYVFSPSDYFSAKFLNEKFIKVQKSSPLINECETGIIDIKGKVIVPTKYRNVFLISGYFKVYDGKNYGLFDTEGNEIFECIYPEIIETDKKFIVHDFSKKEIFKTKEYEK